MGVSTTGWGSSSPWRRKASVSAWRTLELIRCSTQSHCASRA
ncbi:Uncharacterised protein [Bordetella pertussis]|nr:Uncharacterised protein [Bordetella pertussis]